MALPLSILKSVLNLNHNCMHVCNCEKVLVKVHRFGEVHEQLEIHVHAQPTNGFSVFAPSVRKSALAMTGNAIPRQSGVLRT